MSTSPPLGNIAGWQSLRVGGLDRRWEKRRGAPLSVEELLSTGLPRRTDVKKVHQWVNTHITYRPDVDNSWQSPAETLRIKTGDCEDFALLKRGLLKAQGLRDADIVFLLVYDLIAREDHAMLLIWFGSYWLLLDSRTNKLLRADEAEDYRPVLAFNDSNTWTFGRKISW